ncbi:flagellar biosynthesis anti-sigma factor FlgM [bacterium]|nr:flagellar biosynthesis anti-sigma factor FlgM [bacterium]
MKVTQNPIAGGTALENTKAADKAGKVSSTPVQGQKAPVTSAGENATVQISDQALLMKEARDIVHALPDVRADKVSDLKRRIKDGTYQVDSAAIADKMLDEHLATSFGKNNL